MSDNNIYINGEQFIGEIQTLAVEGRSRAMKALAKCPICGHENERICFTEWGIGVVEDYYACRKCSYAEKMAYSDYLIVIRKGYPKKYKNKVKERDIKVLSKKDYCHIIEERDYKLLPFRIIDRIKSLIVRSNE